MEEDFLYVDSVTRQLHLGVFFAKEFNFHVLLIRTVVENGEEIAGLRRKALSVASGSPRYPEKTWCPPIYISSVSPTCDISPCLPERRIIFPEEGLILDQRQTISTLK